MAIVTIIIKFMAIIIITIAIIIVIIEIIARIHLMAKQLFY